MTKDAATSDTPRTDALIAEHPNHIYCPALRDFARQLERELAAAQRDAERLDWMTRHISGAELRRIGIVWPAWTLDNARAAIDAAKEGK